MKNNKHIKKLIEYVDFLLIHRFSLTKLDYFGIAFFLLVAVLHDLASRCENNFLIVLAFFSNTFFLFFIFYIIILSYHNRDKYIKNIPNDFWLSVFSQIFLLSCWLFFVTIIYMDLYAFFYKGAL